MKILVQIAERLASDGRIIRASMSASTAVRNGGAMMMSNQPEFRYEYAESQSNFERRRDEFAKQVRQAALVEAERLAEEVAKEVGGKFWETHRLNTGLLKLIARLREKGKCPYCGKPIETSVSRKIIDRAWNPIRQKQEVRTRTIDFCSQDCGSYYQMGCEG